MQYSILYWISVKVVSHYHVDDLLQREAEQHGEGIRFILYRPLQVIVAVGDKDILQ